MIVKQNQLRRSKGPDSAPQRPPESGVGPVYRFPASAFSVRGFRDWYLAGGHSRYGKTGFVEGQIFVEDLVRGALFWIPESAMSPAGFRDWAFSGEYPPYGKVEYLGGEIFVNMNAEAINTHLKVKMEITRVIGNLAVEHNLGLVYPDGTLVMNETAGLSNEPDATFCSWEALESGRIREATRKGVSDDEKAVALQGTVDWVLEVISPDTVQKDAVELKRKYFQGGVREYWLIDARGGNIEFQVFTRGRTRFKTEKHRGGWVLSPVFDRKFSLQRRDYKGFWRYELMVAPFKSR